MVESFLFNSMAQLNIALVIPESIVIYRERKYIKIQRLERIKYVLIQKCCDCIKISRSLHY